MRHGRTGRRAVAAALLAGLAAGCASQGTIENPLTRRATWVDYISGGDIRRACAAEEPGAVGRYRLVEYRNRAEQVRVYDIYPDDAPGARLKAQVLGGGGEIEGGTLTAGDPLAPWTPRTATARLSEAQLRALGAEMEEAGLGEPPPVGRTLASRSYFWLVAGCGAGHGFGFQVWEWPSAAYKSLAFPEMLHAVDGTGVPLEPLPETEERQKNYANRIRQDRINDRDNYEHYDLVVEEQGVGMGRVYFRGR